MSTNIITLANEKGGVGKTFLAVQLALYAAQQFKLKTLVIDLDSQGNASSILKKNDQVLVADGITSADLFSKDCSITAADKEHALVLVSAPASGHELQSIAQSNDEVQKDMLLNFYNLVSAEAGKFDIVIIDTNPNADLRSTCAIACSTHVLCPIQLYQESIDGINGMCERILGGNDKVNMFLIPSMLESNSYQMKNAEVLIQYLSHMLLPVTEYVIEKEEGEDGAKLQITPKEMFAAIKRRSAFAEAQGSGKPIQQVPNSERAWKELKRVFFSICATLDVDREDAMTVEQKAAVKKLAETYPEQWQTLLKQYWMSNSRADLACIDKVTSCDLAALKTTCSKPFVRNLDYLLQ